jgi:hypothetical protein
LVDEDVHSWDRDGRALIVDRETGSLVVAAKQEGFVRLEATSRIIAAIPAAAGWNLKKRAPAPFDTSINYEYKNAMLRA